MDNIKYFLYSEEQLQERNSILIKQGKEFVPGTVYVGNARKQFTQIANTPTIERFIDTKVVAKGNINKTKYVMPKTKRKEN